MQQFNLPNDVQHLFTVEVLLDHSKTKDHLGCDKGDVLFVLLIAHDKMSSDLYLAEKEDGISELSVLCVLIDAALQDRQKQIKKCPDLL